MLRPARRRLPPRDLLRLLRGGIFVVPDIRRCFFDGCVRAVCDPGQICARPCALRLQFRAPDFAPRLRGCSAGLLLAGRLCRRMLFWGTIRVLEFAVSPGTDARSPAFRLRYIPRLLILPFGPSVPVVLYGASWRWRGIRPLRGQRRRRGSDPQRCCFAPGPGLPAVLRRGRRESLRRVCRFHPA